MKKLYNKALMYQYFYIGKWALLLSSFFYGFVCYESINTNLICMKGNISCLQDNQYYVQNYDIRLISWGILLMLYVIITGISKRNSMVFLTSGPYTKAEIKKNELLFLFISLCTLIAVFVYVSVCIYYREIDLINLSQGFPRESFKEGVKLFICGIAFISYLSLMDCLFSNIGITVFLMITSPFIIAFDIMLFKSSLNNLECNVIYNNKVINYISSTIRGMEDFVFGSINYNSYNTYCIIGLIIIGTVIFFVLTGYAVRKLFINNTNKFFSFPIVEKIFICCLSISIVLLMSHIMINIYIGRYYRTYSEIATFNFHGIIYIVLIIIASYILNKILSRQLKKII